MELKFILDKRYDLSFVHTKKNKDYVNNQYKTSTIYLKKTIKLYQESWNEINNDFSKYVENKTGYKWFYPKYYCVLSVIHTGISNWGDSPKIVRIWNRNPYSMRRITAHELILSHYFEIHKRFYSNANITNEQIWALAEIAANALGSLTKEVKNFWPWDVTYFKDPEYTQIHNLQNKLKDIFLKQKNFDEYILKGIEAVKKYPKISNNK